MLLFCILGLAWLIIPSGIGYTSDVFLYNSWRIFLMICAIPSIIVGVCLFFLPESPKYLLMRQQGDEAMDVLRLIYASNTGNPPSSYPVSTEILYQFFSNIDR